jgi:hypothetical protein
MKVVIGGIGLFFRYSALPLGGLGEYIVTPGAQNALRDGAREN